MKSLTAPLSSDIASDQFDKIALCVVGLSSQTVRLSTDPAGLTFGGFEYLGKGFEISELQYSSENVIDQLTLSLSNIDGFWADRYAAEDLVGRTVLIAISSRTQAPSATADFVTLFDGRIDGAKFTPQAVELPVRSWLDAFNYPMPRRRFSKLCNYKLYDGRCAVVLGTNVITGTATAGDSRHLADTVGLNQAVDFWNYGTLEMTSGMNIFMQRQVIDFAGFSVVIDYPLPNPVSAGDGYKLTRGCQKTFSVCKNNFSNQDNFGGFNHIPLRGFI
jgi:hypothetical protein